LDFFSFGKKKDIDMALEGTIGFGIIGSGMIANFHAEAIRIIPDANLVGIYGRNKEKTADVANSYNCIPYDNLDDLLSNDKVQVVTIATPSGAHLDPCLKAAKSSKHIICEKPLEINAHRINQIIIECEKRGVTLSGIFNRRFNLAVAALKRAIDEGRFGKLSLCDAYVKWYRDEDYYDSGLWRGTKELDGGGALMNQSIHTIDLLQYLAGPIVSLSGSVTCVSHENIEVEDTAVAILKYENGARGVIEGSTSCWSSQGHPAEIHICGSEGSVFLKDDQFSVWDFKNIRPEDELIRATMMDTSEIGLGANDPGAINVKGHVENFKNVIEAIQSKTEPIVSGKEAMKSVNIINAIYESSAANGGWVTLSK